MKNIPSAYKTLAIINLILAILMAIVSNFVMTAIKQALSSADPNIGGPETFAVVFIGTFIMGPAILIMLIVPAIITICQSVKFLKREVLTTSSPWFVAAMAGIGVEIVTLAAIALWW